MRYVLGIDGGGSKCEALLLREDGTAVGWGRVTAADIGQDHAEWRGVGRSVKAISLAAHRALRSIKDLPCDELHISSVSGWLPLGFWRRIPVDRILINVVQEYEAAFALAGETRGVVALAGTGAFIYACTDDKKRAFYDGLGPLLGDHGGGYEIGFHALRAAARHYWHPRYETSLTERVYKAMSITEYGPGGYHLIGIFERENNRTLVASLAKIVDEEAGKGDQIAQQIMQRAAEALGETLFDVTDSLGIRDAVYPMVCTGGLMQSERYYQMFCTRAREIAPGLTPFRSDLPPVVGIALPTLYKIVPDAPDILLETVRTSTVELLERKAQEPEEPLLPLGRPVDVKPSM